MTLFYNLFAKCNSLNLEGEIAKLAALVFTSHIDYAGQLKSTRAPVMRLPGHTSCTVSIKILRTQNAKGVTLPRCVFWISIQADCWVFRVLSFVFKMRKHEPDNKLQTYYLYTSKNK